MNKYTVYILVGLFVAFLPVEVSAQSIKEGTIAIEGWSSVFNESRGFDNGNDSHEFGLSVSGGYFLKDNIEIGTGLSYDNYSSDLLNSKSWAFSPFTLYHRPLNEKFNLYAGAGILFTIKDTDCSGQKTTQNSSGFKVRAGGEFFINNNVAMNIGLSFSRVDWSLDGYSYSSSKENRLYWPEIGLRIYF